MPLAAAAKSRQSCPTLCDPIDSSPLGSSVPGILQARTLEWVAISFSNAQKWKVKGKSLSCAQLSDPMDCSPPGSSVHGIFQARVLDWGAIAFSASSVYRGVRRWPQEADHCGARRQKEAWLCRGDRRSCCWNLVRGRWEGQCWQREKNAQS